MKTKILILSSLALAFCAASTSRGEDMVTHWNAVLETAMKTAKEGQGTQGRIAATVQSAVFDAVNGIARKYTPIHVTDDAPGGARQEAAVAQAAYTALLAIYPLQKNTFDAELAVTLAAIPGSNGQSQSIAKGIAWGEQVANQIVDWRNHDGFNDPATPYFGGTGIGQWRSIPNGTLPAILPQMATLETFAIASHSQFRPGPPPDLNSAQYAADLNEVKTRGRSTGSTRTDAETLLARFWAATDCADENRAARGLLSDSASLVDNARALALANIAFADAVIVGFDCKYVYNFWRPFHAIRFADLDGNADTSVDADWTPLITTPNHQEYFSNHSVATGAFMHTLSLIFGENNPLTLTTPTFPGVAYQFSNLAEPVDSVKEARILGGIHYRFSCDRGQQAGYEIAEYILSHAVLPVHQH